MKHANTAVSLINNEYAELVLNQIKTLKSKLDTEVNGQNRESVISGLSSDISDWETAVNLQCDCDGVKNAFEVEFGILVHNHVHGKILSRPEIIASVAKKVKIACENEKIENEASE